MCGKANQGQPTQTFDQFAQQTANVPPAVQSVGILPETVEIVEALLAVSKESIALIKDVARAAHLAGEDTDAAALALIGLNALKYQQVLVSFLEAVDQFENGQTKQAQVLADLGTHFAFTQGADSGDEDATYQR